MGLTAQGDGDLPATHGPGGIDPEDAAFNETFRAWKESLAIEGIVESDAELEVQLNLLFNWGGRRERGEVNALPHPLRFADEAEGCDVPESARPCNQARALVS